MMPLCTLLNLGSSASLVPPPSSLVTQTRFFHPLAPIRDWHQHGWIVRSWPVHRLDLPLVYDNFTSLKSSMYSGAGLISQALNFWFNLFSCVEFDMV
jgi:hypothetical protein